MGYILKRKIYKIHNNININYNQNGKYRVYII